MVLNVKTLHLHDTNTQQHGRDGSMQRDKLSDKLPLLINFFGPKTGLAQLGPVDPFTASLCHAQDSPAFSRFCAKLEF